MDIILLERIAKLGAMGDVVSVKDGYARNFLLPQKKALRANESNRKVYEANRERLEKMKRLGVKPTHTPRATGNRLAGKTVVVTGTLTRFSRDEIHKIIEREGGKPSSSVSSKRSSAWLTARRGMRSGWS